MRKVVSQFYHKTAHLHKNHRHVNTIDLQIQLYILPAYSIFAAFNSVAINILFMVPKQQDTMKYYFYIECTPKRHTVINTLDVWNLCHDQLPSCLYISNCYHF